MAKREHRRTCRARVRIPLLVYGYTPAGAPFLDEAHTIAINAHGALLSMKPAVSLGERLLLTNEANQRSQECTVVAVTERRGRDAEVAVAFAKPAPQFWREMVERCRKSAPETAKASPPGEAFAARQARTEFRWA